MSASPLRHTVSGRWRLGLALAVLATLAWATLPVALALALVYVDSWTLTWFRFLVAALVLTAWIQKRGVLAVASHRTTRRLWLLLFVAAATLTANYMLFILGLERTTPAVAQVLIQLAPVLMGLGGIWLFRERYSKSQWTGFGVLVIGLLVFSGRQFGSLSAGDPRLWKGGLLIVLAAIVWAVYALTQKQLLRDYSSVAVMAFIYVFATIVIFPATRPTTLFHLAPLAWLIVAYCALNTLVAYSAFAESLNHWEASRVSAVLALTPLGTLAFVVSAERFYPGVLPPERLDWLSLTGAALVVAGSLATSLTGRAHAKPSALID